MDINLETNLLTVTVAALGFMTADMLFERRPYRGLVCISATAFLSRVLMGSWVQSGLLTAALVLVGLAGTMLAGNKKK